MRLTPRLSARAWIIVLIGALGFLLWTNVQRIQRVAAVTQTDAVDAVVDPDSTTGYAGGKRWLIVPEHHNQSYRLIMETQEMLARHEWRLRSVAYENAPHGRAVYSASPYRWWLALLGWVEHAVTGVPLPLAIERAALWSDPALHVLFLVVAAVWVRWQFGGRSAAVAAGGIALLFPLAGTFLPGVPDDATLVRILAFASVLPLLSRPKSTLATTTAVRSSMSGRYVAAGVMGGLGLWVSALDQAVIIAGIGLGGAVASWIAARHARASQVQSWSPLPWRLWSLAGATTVLVAYLLEYAPADLALRVDYNHPLYALAWLGLGELLTLMQHGFRWGGANWNRRETVRLVVAAAAIAALPLVMLNAATFAAVPELTASRLSNLPNGVVAKNFATWIVRDGLTGPVAATCLSLLLLGTSVSMLASRRASTERRSNAALVLGPALIALGVAFGQLAWWSIFDALLIVSLVGFFAEPPSVPSPETRAWVWPAITAAVLLAGAWQLKPLPAQEGELAFTRTEVEGLLERAIAHWITDHAGPEGAVVLLPPYRTSAATFHGGFSGLGSDSVENREGLAATIRIVTATSPEEAQTLLGERGVTHLVLPSWDEDLNRFAEWMHSNPQDAFIMALHRWVLPVWLRPLPYPLPVVPGFENHAVTILEVTNETNRAVALSRVVEYFIETRRTELVVASKPALERFPADLSALIALAQVQKISGDTTGYTSTFDLLVTTIENGLDRSLPWDRRLSLAVVFAEGKRSDLAREQLERCLEKIDAARLRSLTPASLFRLHVLTQVLGREIADPALRELAKRLLPIELREQL